LRALFDLRAVLTDRQASQKRLFDAGLATRYDLAQQEVQLASLDAQEESAWNQLLASSSHLGTLITGDQRALLLPADAEALLRQPVTIDQTGVYDRALRANPGIKVAEEDYGASKLTLSASNAAVSGSYPISIQGISGTLTASVAVSLQVTGAGSYSLKTSAAAVSVAQGGAGTAAITVAPTNGFNSTVNLSVSGLPPLRKW